MKLSDKYDLFELLQKTGIHNHPERLSPEELDAIGRNPANRDKLFRAMENSSHNIYQELEMSSPYVDTHRDVSDRPEKLQLHSHSFYEMIYCESGNIQYLIGDKRYRIHGGDIILIPPGVSHRPLFYEEMTEPYSRIVLWISADFLRSLSAYCPLDLLHRIREHEHFLLRTEGTSYKYLADFFRRGVKEATQKAPLWEVSLYGNTATLLVHLCRALLYSNETFPIEKEEEIDHIISYIENHYNEKITMDETAREFHISTSTLGKLFYNKLGISFYHFVTQRRLINSKLKIEEGNSMEEVALSCGFGDYSAFYRAFKKEYGISPRDYKKLVLSMRVSTI